MTDKRVKDFIQDISGQFNWMSIASGDLTDEEYILLEQQAAQAGLPIDIVMKEVTKWNGNPLPEDERYSMRQTPSRRKAANIRNRRSRYEPGDYEANKSFKSQKVAKTDFGWITIEDNSIDYDYLKDAGERFGVELNNASFGNTKTVAAYWGSQEKIISLADFLGGSLKFESENRIARRSASRTPFYERASMRNKRANEYGTFLIKRVPVDEASYEEESAIETLIEETFLDITVLDVYSYDDHHYTGERASADITVEGDEHEVQELAKFVNYTGESEAIRVGSRRQPRHFNKRASMLGGDDLDSWLVNIDMNSVDIEEVADAIVEYAGEDQVKRWAIGEDDGGEYPYEVDEALDSVGDIFMYSSIPGLVRNELIDRFGKTSRTSFYERTSMRNKKASGPIAEYKLEKLPVDEASYEYEKELVEALKYDFPDIKVLDIYTYEDYGQYGEPAVADITVEGTFRDVSDFARYFDPTYHPGRIVRNSSRRQPRARRAQVARRGSGRAFYNPNEKDTSMNRDRRNRTAGMLDSSGYEPRNRNRTAAEIDRLRRARIANRLAASDRASRVRDIVDEDMRMANRTRIAGRSPLERNIAQLTLAVRRLAAIQAKIDKDPLEDVSKDIENVEEPVEEPKEIELDTEDLNEQPESADDAKEEESEDENPVVDSEVVAKRPIRMASRPTATDDFDLF